MGIIAGVLDAVNASAADAGALRVLAINLRVGRMTEAIPDALTFAFEALSEGTISEGAELVLEIVEPTSFCLECGSEFSSSSYTDISSSGEHLSSEAIEALSSAKQPKSSSSIISAGIPHTYSSSSVKQPSSSSYEPPLQAGILPPYEDSSSSETPSSSSEEKSSSSEADIPDPRIIPVIDTLSPRIHLCEDPNDPRCLIESMVTTFEQDDIQA